MTLIVTGNTYPHKELIKDLGGQWDSEARHWTLPSRTAKQHTARLEELGLWVREDTPQPARSAEPKPSKSNPAMRAAIKAIETGAYRYRQQPEISGDISIHGNDESWLGKFDRNPTAFFGFATYDDMLDFVDQTPDHMRSNTDGWERGNSSWSGSRDMSHAMQMARDGWPEGVKLAREVLDLLDGEHAQARQRTYRVAGGRVNVGRMLAGSPLHMSSRPRRDGRRVITLLCDIVASGSIDERTLIIRAACVAAICDMLESQEYSCEIIMVGMSSSQGVRCQTATAIKQAGEALNLENITFALGHPSILRRMYFALAANEPRLRPMWGSMGRPEASFIETDPSSYYIGNLRYNTDDPHEILTRIIPEDFPISVVDNS